MTPTASATLTENLAGDQENYVIGGTNPADGSYVEGTAQAAYDQSVAYAQSLAGDGTNPGLWDAQTAAQNQYQTDIAAAQDTWLGCELHGGRSHGRFRR